MAGYGHPYVIHAANLVSCRGDFGKNFIYFDAGIWMIDGSSVLMNIIWLDVSVFVML